MRNIKKTINLTNLETSDIKFEVSSFPDGQQQVRIIPFSWQEDDFNVIFEVGESIVFKFPSDFKVEIKSRLNNFRDLELIICTVASLRGLGVKEIHLFVPFFLGSRSDRKFEEGSNNYLKDVICPILNSLNFESVTVIDPHSDVLEACLNNFKKVDNKDLVDFALFHSAHSIWKSNDRELHLKDKLILISPDAGANKKIFKLAEQIGYKGEIITCSKSRDVNGKLSKTNVPFTNDQLHSGKSFIIIDDICDGGRTFINIALEIKSQNPLADIYLIITHGIFSARFKELNKYFDGIYCTNSYSNVGDFVSNLGDLEATNVKQLKVL